MMLYKKIIRPFLFLFDPEFIHGITFFFFRYFPVMGRILRNRISWNNSSPGSDISLLNLKFRHPVGIAGGLDKNAVALRFMKNLGFSFMEIGTVTPMAQNGNPRPRLFRLKRNQAFINRMGFNNDGLETIRRRLLNRPKDFIIGGNIGKNMQTPNEDAWKDYLTCFIGLYPCVDFFIVNVSCPNIKDLRQLQNRSQLKEILMHLIDYRSGMPEKRPVLLKISPDLSYVQLDEVIEVVKETGIDGLVATNTSIRRIGLDYSDEQISGFGPGGLSGKPLTKISTDIIDYLHKKLGPGYPIIASGGIMSPGDAVEKINAGANLVQLYTGFVYEGPGLLPQILKTIRRKSLPIFALLPLSFALLVFNCSKVNKSLQPQQDSILQSISRYLDWEGENGFNGAVLVKTPGNEPMIRSFGYANEEQLIPNSSQTAFDIGSITKQFTGAAILKLEMLGKLSVNDSIGKYLPSLAPEKGIMTFHQLLTHSSGLPTDIGSDAEVITKDVLLTRINETSLISPPGSGYHYSHAGYNLLGLLIETISGVDYESFLQTHLFKPARMRFTGYRMPDWTATSIAHGYRFCNDWGGPMDSGWLEDGPSWNRRVSGGMLSTLDDLYAWHEALLGNDILDEKSKAKYYYPKNPVRINDVQSSGYGWRIIKTTRQTNVIAHNGWNGRYYSDFMRYLDEKVTIILLSNKFREGNQSIPYEIAKCIFWKDYQPRLTGSLTQCLDSLPDNRLGKLGGKFLTLLANGAEKDFQDFTEKCLASHLIIKFGHDTLVSKLKDLQKRIGPVRIRQIMITDNQMMNIEVCQLGNNQEAFIQLYFDKNEDYKIRGFRFESPDERN